MMNFRRFLKHTGALILAALLLTAGATQTIAQDAKANPAAVRDFNASAALQNSGFYERAATKWTAFIKNHPKDDRLDRVHYYLGICNLHAKKYPEAQKAFQAVLNQFPKFKQLDGAQFNLAMVTYQQAAEGEKPEAFKAAADAFGVVVAKYAQSKYLPRALYFQGDALYKSGDVAGSVAVLTKLTTDHTKSPLLPDALYALGVAQQELGDEEAAVSTLQAFLANPALAKHELTPEIQLRLGMSQFNLKKYAEAEKLFSGVAGLENFAYADFAMLRQGQCKLEAGEPSAALPILVAMIAKHAKSAYLASAQVTAGKCYFLTEKLDDARKVLEPVAAAKAPESAEAAYWLGRTLLAQEKAQDAFARLDAAVKQFTEGEFATYLQVLRIDALYDLPDRRKETVGLYEAFAAKFADHPLTPHTIYMAALAALGEEDYAKARTHAETFLGNAKYAEHALTPAVLYIAAEGYLLPVGTDAEGGDLAKAEQFYRTLVTKFAEHARVPQAHLRITWCLYKADKHADAIKHIGSAIGQLKDPMRIAEAQLLLGQCHAATDQHKEALAAFDSGIKAKPDWDRVDELLIASAQSLRALENSAEAVKRLTQLMASHPESTYRAQALYQLGEIAEGEKKYDDAIARFNEVLAKFPMSDFVAAANYGLGAAYFAKEDHPKAMAALTKLLADKNAGDLLPRGQYLRGLTYQRMKEFEPALKDLQAYLATKPEGDDALGARFAMAICQVGLKQYAAASTALTALLTDKPDFTDADKVYYELGHALAAQDKAKEAADAFGTLAAKLPDSPLAAESLFHVGLYHAKAADGDQTKEGKAAKTAEAAKAFTAGLAKAKAPELREKLQYKLGDMQFRQEDFAKASATLLAQIKEYPQGELAGPGRFLAAESLFRMDQFTQALPLYVQVAADKVEQYHDQSLYRAGTCAANLKQWPASQQHYTALIGQFPKYEQISEARYGLALALQNQNKLAEARQIYEQVTKESEAEVAAKARFMIGEIAFAEKKYEDAIAEFLVVTVGYPYKQWQGLARFETARCYIELMKNEKALAELTTLVEKYADHAKVPDANKLIADLKK